jgi:hypothetical protein
MRSSFSLVHPRRALRRLLDEYATGRRTRLLQEIPFASGLGDSVWVLYGLARSLKPEVCVEIGSARGKSACYVGLALEENGKGKLYAIDPHTKTEWNDSNSVETYEVMRQNLGSLGLLDRVEIVRKTSGQARPELEHAHRSDLHRRRPQLRGGQEGLGALHPAPGAIRCCRVPRHGLGDRPREPAQERP